MPHCPNDSTPDAMQCPGGLNCSIVDVQLERDQRVEPHNLLGPLDQKDAEFDGGMDRSRHDASAGPQKNGGNAPNSNNAS